MTGTPGLVHQGLVYGSDEDFLAATVPFCLEGLDRGDEVLAITRPGNLDLLRQALGDAAGEVGFTAAEEWYRTPGRTLAAYHRRVDGHTAPGRRVRVIGEPVWHGRDELETAEWIRYEAAINVAFAGSAAWIVCPYDSRALPAPVVAGARRTHPQLVTGAGVERSRDYAHPHDGTWERRPTPVRAEGEATMGFDADLTAVRSFVAATAAALGASPGRVDHLVFAVNEVAANAVQHGGGRGEVSLWRAGARVVCDVRDRGRGGAGWFTGYLPPDPAQPRGHGLWAVRQLCDLLEVHAGGPGTTVRLHLGVD
ncbi:sensor histidine kinase [Saccharothrix algeriensis]|uniref:Anti-sigma regulatory factor (Ser/Thr protein kinase) n=1 Tax=Saccharothrix algeriensis TaxID=173560 RepID=A0A8T8HY28_9PSEU|nr:sensor histidine kinase [Saccharothrix algeriensis]MBM7815195.1 anti-sigma regulatory factor (Ser/Thr protein kinase) [Saccharothrix algeriensis]QTR03432.1 sensor histidine kinase [Saccharothrix algeriensis]